eukprot:8346740-Alexandrium_andersonii.AAC.1
MEDATCVHARRRGPRTRRAAPYEAVALPAVLDTHQPLEAGLHGARLAMDRLCAHGFPPGYQWSSVVGSVCQPPNQAVMDALRPE